MVVDALVRVSTTICFHFAHTVPFLLHLALCSCFAVFLPVLGVPMAAAMVATMVVGPVVKIVMEKACSQLLDQYKVMKGMEEQHAILKRKLLLILGIIANAEQAAADSEQAAARRAGVAAWLEDTKKVAYEANEVFDEFKYEALRREAKRKGHYRELGFHVVKLFPTHNRFVFRNRMGRKLRKVVRGIDVLVNEMNAFGFQNQQRQPVTNQWREMDNDFFDMKNITSRSRENDHKNIVDIIVGQANNADLTVVPIVGMGGLGKTTLAQLVYNDPEIQKHFNMLLWVCVSDVFDVDSLAKSIVDAAPGKKDDDTEVLASKKKTPLDILQNVVSGRRYLLVMDDVWTREVHKWEKLKARLEHGGMGSVVLTTTRDEGVAEIMGTVEPYNLKALEEKYIKEIIETRAFSCFQRIEDRPIALVNMVGEIVKRCVGSPLAATALGSVLRTKTSEEEWKAVSIRSSICTEETGILPILKLSYNDLPQHMKQCFAFCAIFPKDYEIDVDKLIQLWIAHGFITEEEKVRLETIGKQIFKELTSRSFFQDVKQVQATVKEIEDTGLCYSRTACKIHDLMHDVALSVMQKECALRTDEPSQSDWLPDNVRHLFLSCNGSNLVFDGFPENYSPAIQTILCDRVTFIRPHHLSKYSSLQALQLYSHGTLFPLKPKHLHHLRYLDLSRSDMKELPADMSILYNLQTLNLSGCKYLSGLPKQLKYMTSLRHLYTHGCPELKSMPTDIGKLTSLQTLTCFVAGSGSNCSNVGELGNLNLGGQLELRNLENVTEEDATGANLVNKKELRELTLRWSSGGKVARVLLENLKPHDGLHAIRIHSYLATTFPTWMAMLQNFVEIHLVDCKKLQWLFSHNHGTSFAFQNLKELTLEGLVCLERWWEIDNDVMQGEEIMFPLLEKLCIRDCEKLTALPGQPTFPHLQKVFIERCPELTTTAKSPQLSQLCMEAHEAEMYTWVARHVTSLTNLQLHILEDNTETTLAAAEHGLRDVLDVKGNWNGHDFPLAAMKLSNFNSGVTELCEYFLHLEKLSIHNSDALVHWPQKGFEGLVSLRRLRIERCKNLTGYAQAPAEPSISSETRQLLPHLESLEIKWCDSLVAVFSVPASLREMCIYSCSKLESISCMSLQHGQSGSLIRQGSSSVPEVSSSSSPTAVAEHLEILSVNCCRGLTRILHLPQSLKKVQIFICTGLTSLESRSGDLPSLELLYLWKCRTLSSLPDWSEAYSSLQHIIIKNCYGMKTLPVSLQQQLGSMQEEHVDAHYYGKPMLLKPKTWKYVL